MFQELIKKLLLTITVLVSADYFSSLALCVPWCDLHAQKLTDPGYGVKIFMY